MRSSTRRNFPVAVFGKRVDELDLARIFVGGNPFLDEIFEPVGELVARRREVGEDDEGFDLLPALLARHADHRAFGDGGMGEEGVFDFGGGDVVARADDHVVAAGAVPEVAVVILGVGVAGDVPAVLDVIGLARVVEVAAAGRAADREAAFAGGEFVAVGVEDRGGVAGDGLAGAAGADGVAAGAR